MPCESSSLFMARTLNECQHSQALHPRRIKELVAWRSANKDTFLKDWWHAILPIFTIFKREPAVERAVIFVASFVAYRDEAHSHECDTFLEEFFGLLLYSTDARNRAIRFRACQILSEVVMRLEENAEVSDELWDEMIACMQRRLKDKMPSVRVFSARALARFANADVEGGIENDPIVKAYRQTLQSDQNAEVRKTVILSMPASNATIIDIVKHTVDVSDVVRRAAFIVLSNKVPIQSLSIKQRASVLRRGLHDRVISVQMECLKMLKEAWFTKCCQGDVIVLLKYLDVETHEEICESVILALLEGDLVPFQNEKSIQKHFPPCNDFGKGDGIKKEQLMEAEDALLWRMLCSYLQSVVQAKGHDAATTGGAETAVHAAEAAEKNDFLEKILPATVADYVDLVREHLDAGANYRFVSRQLLLLGKFVDFSDASNRKTASLLVQSLLRMPAESGHVDSEEDNEILIGDGLSVGGDKNWASAITVLAWKVYDAEGEFENVIAEAVAELGQPCREGGANIMQWINCLSLTGLLLENLQSLQQLSGLAIDPQEILNGLLLPAAKHIHPEVQRAAQRCLGLFSLREHTPSKEVIRQLRSSVSSSFVSVQILAIKALFDLSMWHGAAVLDKAIGIGPDLGPVPMPKMQEIQVQEAEKNEESNRFTPVLEFLALRLDENSDGKNGRESNEHTKEETVQSVTAECFAKLVLQSKVFSDVLRMQQVVLEKLLHLYFKDQNKAFPRLMQCLSVFFETYPSVAIEHKKCISKALIPILRSEWKKFYGDASGSSVKVAGWKRHAAQICKFMLQLLHRPLFKAQADLANTTIEGSGIDQQGLLEKNAKEDGVGDEELAIRIAVEVISFPQRRSASGKSYMAMLSKVAASLEFRPSQQEAIKCMRKLLDHMIESVAGDKQVVKELESMGVRLKALDTAPEDGLSDQQLQIILRNLEVENFKFGVSTEEASSLAHTRKGTSRKKTGRPNKTVTPDSPPVFMMPVLPASMPRSQRACKTAALRKMRSELTASKRAICMTSEESMSSSSEKDSDSEFEVNEEQGLEVCVGTEVQASAIDCHHNDDSWKMLNESESVVTDALESGEGDVTSQ